MNDVNKYIETMRRVSQIFNNNKVSYALAGGVVAELRSGVIKEHKDVDFAIMQRDIPKIEELLKQNGIYSQNRTIQVLESNSWADTTGHNEIAKDINTGVDIGFFIYDNQDDEFDEYGEIVSEEGFVRKTIISYGGRNIILRERMDKALQEYLFSSDRHEELDGVKIRVQPLPYIMMLKARNIRNKDRTDLVNTTQLLTESEIDEYNKFKKYITNIKYTAQCGKGSLEGDCEEVRKLIDLQFGYNGNAPIHNDGERL